jgi:acyl transferase domain-containing protein
VRNSRIEEIDMSITPEHIASLSPTKRALLALELQSKLDALDRLKSEPIAIVGLGCRFPGGARGPRSFWQFLCDGVDAIEEVPPDRWDAQAFYDPDPTTPGKMNTRWGGFLNDVSQFDAEFFGISPREAERLDPQQRMLLEVSWEALEDAGLAPDRIRGSKTGVFIGRMTDDYSRIHPNDRRYIDVYSGLGNAASLAPNRLSYFFDFHGPSIAIDTACSSSLVAVHLACQSLRAGESDMTLVGGVNLILTPDNTIVYSQAGLTSPDGRCKPFDAQADGYVRGEGVGVVLLKLLSRAIAERNQIYAVIRGSAVNQNGRHSNGLTAPSQKAQVEMLREAYSRSGVSPGQVQYVETMGLGTALGDAIEAKALGEVLSAERVSGEPCAIGSVKSNFGHLEAAAGMAGLIKVALSLKHRQIPPSLHYARPNPYIPFDELPLRIQQRLEPWPRRGLPALAGVSSLSISGANAHVVVEEAPTVEPVGGVRPWHLLLLSAQTKSALETATANLANYLRQTPQPQLADVAYTLQVGRSAFDHRRFVVCQGIEDAVNALEGTDSERVQTVFQKKARPALFMFPQRESFDLKSVDALYQSESGFRKQFDTCAEILEPQMKFDLRRTMNEIARPGSGGTPFLQRSEISQALLFVIEYALAKLWMGWGAHPSAMIGYGVGEIVAACLAGVFSLPNALSLIVKRAQVIQWQQSDPPKTLEQICNDFRQLLESVELLTPQLPYLSGVTGKWINAEEATDPSHWASQLCRPARFAEALGQALMGADRVFMEIGPGEDLCSIVRLHPDCDSERARCVIPTLPDAADQQTASRRLTTTVGELWLAGVQINWDGFNAEEKRRCISLPTYPFERQRYWYESGETSGSPTTNGAQSIDNKKARARPALTAAYVAPRNDIERNITRIWQDLLRIEQIGVHDDFLELGVQSLLATQLFSRLRKEFHVELPMQSLLEMRTVALQADLIATIHWASQAPEPPSPLGKVENGITEGEL